MAAQPSPDPTPCLRKFRTFRKFRHSSTSAVLLVESSESFEARSTTRIEELRHRAREFERLQAEVHQARFGVGSDVPTGHWSSHRPGENSIVSGGSTPNVPVRRRVEFFEGEGRRLN